ncbi:MAG TPA: hypothetical protein VLY20_12510 [Nitrospiria bacterium]|nr:hypothetical protein [Nitrospiria bacterium]
MRNLAVLVALFLVSCAGAGGLKPSIYTAPPSYLESFPLGSVTETEMTLKSGPPDKIIEIEGKRAVVYQLGEGHGLRTFTYIIEGGVITDVLYNDNGPYNGSTAKQMQKR